VSIAQQNLLTGYSTYVYLIGCYTFKNPLINFISGLITNNQS